MALRKSGTVTGASLESKSKGKKGGLTGSKRVTGESETKFELATTFVSESPEVPTVLPTSDPEVAETDANARAKLPDLLQRGGQVIGTVVNTASAAIQSGADINPSSITDGTLDTAGILAKSSAEIDESVQQLDSGEAIRRNIIIARQRNYVGVAINNTKLKQDVATLDLEQQRLIGLLIDGKSAHVDNEKKAVTYHRTVVGRDTELSKLEQDRELLTQQQIRTEGTQGQTSLIQEQEQLKIQMLREQNEKQKYEIESVSYEKEKIKQEAVAKFSAGF